MDQETKLNEADENNAEPVDKPQEDNMADGEFKVTVRKLEVPVRPRGVLAE